MLILYKQKNQISIVIIFKHLVHCIMDKTKAFESYDTPQVEIIEVEIEKGFASSMNPEDQPW